MKIISEPKPTLAAKDLPEGRIVQIVSWDRPNRIGQLAMKIQGYLIIFESAELLDNILSWDSVKNEIRQFRVLEKGTFIEL